MRRVIGSWLDGPKGALNHAREQGDEARPKWRGEQLGLPEDGPGAAAPLGKRALAFLIDIVLAALITAAFTVPNYPGDWSLLTWFLITVIPVSFFGVTPGMAMLRIWVARTDSTAMVGPLRAVLRCGLTLLIIPAVVWNFDGRSWHDRLSGTIVLRR
ncbi:RDD family protein [Saccharopolyspora sp. K220]|uniref:RDD family protein n=1 Tax=Saccharopolyspora soli TaxID=2926618 RepID=UPI001F59EAC5|nr:RDD family protein [Saccharopolyspora soli]MCI2421221.1 RDD family protein [Saccharopolyspora soli]